jgi:hypothetical protein
MKYIGDSSAVRAAWVKQIEKNARRGGVSPEKTAEWELMTWPSKSASR